MPSGRNVIGMGAERRLAFLFLSYFTNKYFFTSLSLGTFKSFTNVIWVYRFLFETNLKM